MSSGISEMSSFQKGQRVRGVVKKIKSYGAFVKIDNSAISGIIYKEDISNMYINAPSDKLNIGETTNFIVKKYNNDTGKLVLSNIANDFSDMVSELNVNDTLKGIVRNQYKSGVFIEIKQNLVGFADYKYGLSYGDKVCVKIKDINEEEQKIKLEILD